MLFSWKQLGLCLLNYECILFDTAILNEDLVFGYKNMQEKTCVYLIIVALFTTPAKDINGLMKCNMETQWVKEYAGVIMS